MAIRKIPVILTEADWKKNKGLLAKGVGETGVGAAMGQLKTAYEAVDWDKFDVKKALKGGAATTGGGGGGGGGGKLEWEKKVIPLLGKAYSLDDAAKNALAKYKAAKVP